MSISGSAQAFHLLFFFQPIWKPLELTFSSGPFRFGQMVKQIRNCCDLFSFLFRYCFFFKKEKHSSLFTFHYHWPRSPKLTGRDDIFLSLQVTYEWWYFKKMWRPQMNRASWFQSKGLAALMHCTHSEPSQVQSCHQIGLVCFFHQGRSWWELWLVISWLYSYLGSSSEKVQSTLIYSF